MNKTEIPVAIGPGTQPVGEDGAELDYLPMPSGMMTFSMPRIPEPEELGDVSEALALLQQLHRALTQYKAGDAAVSLSLDALDAVNLDLINQMLGNGEVSIQYHGQEGLDVSARIQESVLAGVWRVQYVDAAENVVRDSIEVATIPCLVTQATFNDAAEQVVFSDADIPDIVYNAPPLLTEINDKLPAYVPGSAPHVINLSLLPHTQEDIDFLGEKLGRGRVVMLSRGYGNCRITSTLTRNVWWVQYFNSQDTLILNTIEISHVPDVACAAQEDIDDSAQRLHEILEVYL
jgi:hydrogenase-1 operon protein HyaF